MRCINALHVQTFITSLYAHTKGGTVITFANGDLITVTEEFFHVYEVLVGFVDG